MIKPGDHIMYMGRCAIVAHVYTETASIIRLGRTYGASRRLDVYLTDIVIPGKNHGCIQA